MHLYQENFFSFRKQLIWYALQKSLHDACLVHLNPIILEILRFILKKEVRVPMTPGKSTRRFYFLEYKSSHEIDKLYTSKEK